ncbi:hypothetical protein EDB89DRAFT_921514 [Lactarius sanguifluus]|nr:hypothetical protein EDB89DRAFT_921514 [Lactarius sanguifluus]
MLYYYSSDPRAVSLSSAPSPSLRGFHPRADISEPVTDVTVILDSPCRAVHPRPRTVPTQGRQQFPAATRPRRSWTRAFTHKRLPLRSARPSSTRAPLPLRLRVRMAAEPPAPSQCGKRVCSQREPGHERGPRRSTEKLELDDESVSFALPSLLVSAKFQRRAVETSGSKNFSLEKVYIDGVPRSLSFLSAGSFRLYIREVFGLALLYDPILLEFRKRPTSWSEARPRMLGPPRHTSTMPRKNTLRCAR